MKKNYLAFIRYSCQIYMENNQNMEIKENKYFIYDNPEIITWKYPIKQIKKYIKSYIYSFLYLFIKPKIQEKKYKVSICAIFKNEAKYLKEWIVYNKTVGVEHFYLYNNNSTDNYESILEEFIKSGVVTLIDWPMQQGQMAAYNDCVEKFSEESNWIGFLDLDELVVPIKYDNIYDFLKLHNNKPSVLLYWKMFCTSGHISRNHNKLMSEDFVVSWPKLVNIGKFFFNTSFDYLNNNKENKTMHFHWSGYKKIKLPPVNCYGKVCFLDYNPMNDKELPIQINHFFSKSYNEYLEKISRGDAFFVKNPRNDAYFYELEMKCTSVDYSAYKYLIKVKREMGITE